MMNPMTSHGGHSAIVKIKLLVDGMTIAVDQLGREFLFASTPIDLPPGDASIVMQVDASERRWNIRLPAGLSSTSRRVPILAAN